MNIVSWIPCIFAFGYRSLLGSANPSSFKTSFVSLVLLDVVLFDNGGSLSDLSDVEEDTEEEELDLENPILLENIEEGTWDRSLFTLDSLLACWLSLLCINGIGIALVPKLHKQIYYNEESNPFNDIEQIST